MTSSDVSRLRSFKKIPLRCEIYKPWVLAEELTPTRLFEQNLATKEKNAYVVLCNHQSSAYPKHGDLEFSQVVSLLAELSNIVLKLI